MLRIDVLLVTVGVAFVLAQQAYLKASNPGGPCMPLPNVGDTFGQALAVSGDTVVVGAPLEDGNASGVNGNQHNDLAIDSGAAYVFVRDGAGWSQQAYLKASNPGAGACALLAFGDNFGQAVAISGDTLVVGAPLEDSNATGVNGDQDNDLAAQSGAAYVFVRDGTSWSQQAYLKASNAEGGDLFGWSVSISEDTIVVAARGEDSNATFVNGDQQNDDATDSGAAYVFVRDGTSWTQEAYLKAHNAEAADDFGWSLSSSGDTVVVGAIGEDTGSLAFPNNDASESGAVYVFVRSGSFWIPQAFLKTTSPASNQAAGDEFGTSVAVSGDTLVVGARFEDSSATGVNGLQADEGATGAGAAYVFARSGSLWSQQAYLKASNTGVGDELGVSVAVAGARVVVGAWQEDSGATGLNGLQSDNSATGAGAAYAFARSGTSWSQVAYVKASNTQGGDSFGSAVAVSDCGLVVGAPREDSGSPGVNGDQSDNSVSSSGASYLFELESVVTFRNAGTNPASYAAGPIVIGTTFTATVDNDLASQLTSILFAFDTPFSLLLGGGQTLLCLGSGELLTGSGLSPSSSSGGTDAYALAVPDELSLCGALVHSQAIQFGNPPFVLSNAQDLTIGSF